MDKSAIDAKSIGIYVKAFDADKNDLMCPPSRIERGGLVPPDCLHVAVQFFKREGTRIISVLKLCSLVAFGSVVMFAASHPVADHDPEVWRPQEAQKAVALILERGEIDGRMQPFLTNAP